MPEGLTSIKNAIPVFSRCLSPKQEKLKKLTTHLLDWYPRVSPRINVHALISENRLCKAWLPKKICSCISACTYIRILRACTYIRKLLRIPLCNSKHILQVRIISICIDLYKLLLIYVHNNSNIYFVDRKHKLHYYFFY